MSDEIIKSGAGNGGFKPTSLDEKLAGINKKLKALQQGLEKLEVPRLFHQLVIFVLDASGSMNWEGLHLQSKGEDVRDQIIPILQRLQQSKNKNCFDISMWAFSNEIKQFLPQTSVVDIDINTSDFNPCSHIGNGQTFISDTLIDVECLVNNYLEKHVDKQCKVLMLILSDGDIDDIEKAKEIADRLKSNDKVIISSYLFEDKHWNEKLSKENLSRLRENLKALASSSNSNEMIFFKSTIDPEEIRKHMIKSISTVSKID